MIQIISQKYIEFFSCFVALFCEYKCGLVCLLVTNIAYHAVFLEPLPICEAAIAIGYGLSIYSGSLEGLIEAALHVECMSKLCTLEA